MLFALRFDKFRDNLCKNPPSSMDELREGYIQIEEMSRFRNKVRQVRQKHNK